MKKINALTMRKKFGRILDEVASEKSEPLIICRANEPMAVMISYREFQKINSEQEREKRLRFVAQELDRWSGKNRESLEGLDSVKIIREIRDTH